MCWVRLNRTRHRTGHNGSYERRHPQMLNEPSTSVVANPTSTSDIHIRLVLGIGWCVGSVVRPGSALGYAVVDVPVDSRLRAPSPPTVHSVMIPDSTPTCDLPAPFDRVPPVASEIRMFVNQGKYGVEGHRRAYSTIPALTYSTSSANRTAARSISSKASCFAIDKVPVPGRRVVTKGGD